MMKKRDVDWCPQSPVVDFRRKPAPRAILGTPVPSNRARDLTTCQIAHLLLGRSVENTAIGHPAGASRISALLAAIYEGLPKLMITRESPTLAHDFCNEWIVPAPR